MLPSYRVNSQGLVNGLVLRNRQGTLVGLTIRNTGPDQEIQLFDSAAVPADGTIPSYPPIRVSAGTTVSFDMPETGIPFDNGITVCNSSTVPTKTIGAADCYFGAVIRSQI